MSTELWASNKYYEEYIYSVIADSETKYGKFTDIFPDKKYDERFLKLQQSLNLLEIPKQFSSIIDLDMYFFGHIYTVVFENKTIESGEKENLKKDIENQISEFKLDNSHTKAPSNLGNLRSRISSSIEIYENYAS